RVSIADGSEVVVQPRGGAAASRALGVDAKALAIQGDRIIAMTSDALVVIPLADVPSNTLLQKIQLPFAGARPLSLPGDRVVVCGPGSLALSAAAAPTPTGTFSTAATALAVVPRTDFLYALDEGRVVVVETHGSSPYASIPVTGSFLGVDGEGDKLIVAGATGADLIETGRHALAWRLPGVLFAAVLAFLLVLLARRLFASTVLPALVGLAVLVDGSMFAQARIGMNDIYVATLIVAGWYFVVAAHRPRRWATLDVLIPGVLFGLAFAAKWAGAYTLVGLLVASIAVTARAYERGRPGPCGPLDLFARRGLNAVMLFIAFAAIPAGIYLASYVRWFGGPTIPYGWSLVELTQQMYW